MLIDRSVAARALQELSGCWVAWAGAAPPPVPLGAPRSGCAVLQPLCSAAKTHNGQCLLRCPGHAQGGERGCCQPQALVHLVYNR